jgi:hypothetical protein
MEGICSSETSVDIQRTTQRYIPEDSTFHNVSIFRVEGRVVRCDEGSPLGPQEGARQNLILGNRANRNCEKRKVALIKDQNNYGAGGEWNYELGLSQSEWTTEIEHVTFSRIFCSLFLLARIGPHLFTPS